MELFMLKYSIFLMLLASCEPLVAENLPQRDDVVIYINERFNTSWQSNDLSIASLKAVNKSPTVLLVYSRKQSACGSGGCTLVILGKTNTGFEILGRTNTVKLPITLLGRDHRGYPEIGVWVQGGGVVAGYQAKLTYENGSYPRTPSTAPAQYVGKISEGQVLIAN